MDTPFRNVHHICIVTADLERSQTYYEGLGIGPWADFPSLEAFRADLVAPDPDDFVQLRYRFAQLGDVQLQLCEPPVGNTPQRRFLDASGGGVFHIGFAVADLDVAETGLTALGLTTLLRGRLPNGGGFTYFDTAKDAGVTLQVRAAARPTQGA